MPNIPIVAFDAVDAQGHQRGSAPFPPRSEGESFDSFLKNAGNSLEENGVKTVSDPPKSEKTPEPSDVETEDPGEIHHPSSEGSQEHSGQVEGGELEGQQAAESESPNTSEPRNTAEKNQSEEGGSDTSEKARTNLMPGGGLPFPQLIDPTNEGFEGRPIGNVLASEKSGISLLGKRQMPEAAQNASGGAPGMTALNRQLETQAGMAPQDGDSKNETGNGASENEGVGTAKAQSGKAGEKLLNLPPLDEVEGSEGPGRRTIAKGGPHAGKAQNANDSSPMGRNTPDPGLFVQEGETTDGSGKLNAVGDDLNGWKIGKDSPPKEGPSKPKAKIAGQGAVEGFDGEKAFAASREKVPNGIPSSQPVNLTEDDGANPLLKEDNSALSGADPDTETQGSQSVKNRPEPVSLDGKISQEIQAAPEKKQVHANLRGRVQEQILEVATARVSLAIRDKISHARVRLDPPSLGRVDMELRVEEGTLTAKVKVENTWVKDAINANLRELRNALEKHGVKVEQFSVDVETGSNSWVSDQSFANEGSREALYLESNPLEEDETVPVVSEEGFISNKVASANLDLFA